MPNMDEVVKTLKVVMAENEKDCPEVIDSWLYAQVRLLIEERNTLKDERDYARQQYEKYAEALKGAKSTMFNLADKVAEQDKEIQKYKDALSKIANMELVEGAPTPEMVVARKTLKD